MENVKNTISSNDFGIIHNCLSDLSCVTHMNSLFKLDLYPERLRKKLIIVELTPWLQHDHITPHLKLLNYLPIKFWILFKMFLLSLYAWTQWHQVTFLHFWHHVPANVIHHFNKPPLCELKFYGARSFAFAASTEWNKLPFEIKLAPSVDSFKSKLKTHLFVKHFGEKWIGYLWQFTFSYIRVLLLTSFICDVFHTLYSPLKLLGNSNAK